MPNRWAWGGGRRLEPIRSASLRWRCNTLRAGGSMSYLRGARLANPYVGRAWSRCVLEESVFFSLGTGAVQRRRNRRPALQTQLGFDAFCIRFIPGAPDGFRDATEPASPSTATAEPSPTPHADLTHAEGRSNILHRLGALTTSQLCSRLPITGNPLPHLAAHPRLTAILPPAWSWAC